MQWLEQEATRVNAFIRPIEKIVVEDLTEGKTTVYHENDAHIYTACKYRQALIMGIRSVEGQIVFEGMHFLKTGKSEILRNEFETFQNNFVYAAFFDAVQHMGRGTRTKEEIIYYHLYALLRKIREDDDYLDEEERHLVQVTIPTDMKLFHRSYLRLSNNTKKEADHYRAEVLQLWENQLTGIAESVEERKLRDVEQMVRIVHRRTEE